jgi:hypothetical protein
MKDRHILPDAVMAMRDLLNLNHHEGGGAISEED